MPAFLFSYSGGRDKEDHSSKPDWAKNSRAPILKIPNTKRVVEWLKVKALNSNPGTAKKKKYLSISIIKNKKGTASMIECSPSKTLSSIPTPQHHKGKNKRNQNNKKS
jgi:hypothetical protein